MIVEPDLRLAHVPRNRPQFECLSLMGLLMQYASTSPERGHRGIRACRDGRRAERVG
jgi:hypothetical protein